MSIKFFISYSTADKGKMLSLRKRIEKHNSLKAIVVADDRKASKLLTDKVKDGIDESEYFVCILTAKSITNQWVNQEIGYATAQDRKIRPIVESKVLDKLKGFIHKQMDLPYTVKTNGTSTRAQGILFSKRAKVLVDDILLENNLTPKEIGLESLFPGIWESEFDYMGTGKIDHDRKIEIRNGNEYYVNGKLAFYLDDFSFNAKNKILSFTKRRPDPKEPVAVNELKVIKLGERYEGTETGGTRIAYYRIDSKASTTDANTPTIALSQRNHQGIPLREAHIRNLYKGAHVFHRVNGKGTIQSIGPFVGIHRGRSVVISFEDGRIYNGILNNSKGNYFEWLP